MIDMERIKSAFHCPCKLLIANYRSWEGRLRTIQPYYLRVKRGVAAIISERAMAICYIYFICGWLRET